MRARRWRASLAVPLICALFLLVPTAVTASAAAGAAASTPAPAVTSAAIGVDASAAASATPGPSPTRAPTRSTKSTGGRVVIALFLVAGFVLMARRTRRNR